MPVVSEHLEMSESPFPAPTAFARLSEVCEQIEATSPRLEKMDLAGRLLAGLPAEEVEAAALLLIGQPFPRASSRVFDLDWTTLSRLLEELLNPPRDRFATLFRETGDVGEVVRRLYPETGRVPQRTLLEEPLTIPGVYQAFAAIADLQGPGAQRRKTALLRSLFSRATALEAKYLTRILIADQRIGFNEGMLEAAIARAFNLRLSSVRRANMLMGNIGTVAFIARTEGTSGLQRVQLLPFTPILPMLAAHAEDVADALKQHGGECAFETKLDGARVQVHLQRDGSCRTRIYSRRLTDVTASLPDIVELVEREVTAASSCILEGEVIARGPDGRPYPFQLVMRRFRRVHDIREMIDELPVSLVLFDLLLLNGEALIDSPYTFRRQTLEGVCGSISVVPQLVTSDSREAEGFFEVALQEGHEGLMAKRLDSAYKPGIRGKAWLKIKRSMETLDLIVTAAEYGYGRRHRWLSDYHLAARDAESGELHMLGKTFKGLTDAEFEDITNRLLALKVNQQGNVVFVKPQVVAEVEYDEIQRSPTYPSGMALRFARIKRLRYDKSPNEADTIQRVRELYARQFRRKAASGKVGRTGAGN
jgi:DNA ligase-1